MEDKNIGDKTNQVRINAQITATEVRLIGADGQQAGIVDTRDALHQAREQGLDLVEISPTASPPVCRIIDFGKYQFVRGKKQRRNRSGQVHVKEIKMRPVTDEGDYRIKINKALKFLAQGNKVKITVRFRGREIMYQQQGRELLRRAEEDLHLHGVVEQTPRMEGRQMVMLVGPGKTKRNTAVSEHETTETKTEGNA